MSYAFRTTYRQDAETYVEDRGYAHTVTKGQASFATLDAEFGKILAVGQTARRNSEGDGWEVVDGFPLLDSVKAVKLAEINRAYESTLAALTPTYPNSERLTFNKQEEEARAWDKDNTAPTPLLDALAAGRQMASRTPAHMLLSVSSAESGAERIRSIMQTHKPMVNALYVRITLIIPISTSGMIRCFIAKYTVKLMGITTIYIQYA